MDDKFFLLMVDKFNSSGIAELEFSDGNTRMVLRKEGSGPVYTREPASPQVTASKGAEEHAVRLGLPANTTGEASGGGGETINSPIVATFYSSPSPDAPPFVKQGSKIKAGQTLCILEAMKMMNHLEAEFDCEIVEIHVSGGELVEYGQKLFTVKR